MKDGLGTVKESLNPQERKHLRNGASDSGPPTDERGHPTARKALYVIDKQRVRD